MIHSLHVYFYLTGLYFQELYQVRPILHYVDGEPMGLLEQKHLQTGYPSHLANGVKALMGIL